MQGAATSGPTRLGRSTGDLVFEQDSGRPFVFVARGGENRGIVALNISSEQKPIVVGDWQSPRDVSDLVHFKSGAKYFLAALHPETGATILEVSDPDEGQFDRTAEISVAEGLHHGFSYRHSNGRGYLFATGGGDVHVYDLERLVQGAPAEVATLTLPEKQANTEYGFHSVYVQYEPETESDRLVASGAGGYWVFDVTNVQAPSLIVSVQSAAVQVGTSASMTPDGSHLVTSAGYRTAPMRIFDLRPIFAGNVSVIRTAAGAWTPNWKNYAENHQLRWPYVFVAALDDGFQVFNMLNPFEPFTLGFYHTWDGPIAPLSDRSQNKNGAWDIDVRNRDGLIAVTDVNTGLWLFRLEGFEQWDGRGWGFGNVSSVQDWDNGPVNSKSW